MFEALSLLHEIAAYAAATGISVGLLIGCALLFYFVASARSWVIFAAAAVVGGYLIFIFAEHDGRAEVQARWDAADAAAEKAAQDRDTAIGASTAAKNGLTITALQKQNAALQQQADSYEKMLLATKTGAACPLGAAALRLRQPKSH
jgi:hypothetical protein